MKKLVLFLLLGTLSQVASAQAWVRQASGFSPVSSGVRNVAAVDANIVWISSYDGSSATPANRRDFSRTTNGGATWTAGTIAAPTSYNWSMISAVDSMNAWAAFYNSAAGGGGIWHTSDGGVTWAQQGVGLIYTAATSFPNVVHFWNANEGMAMGDPNAANQFEVYTTTDGGATWTAATSPASLSAEYGVVDHYSVFGNNIWFSTDGGRVFRSADKGLTWTVSTTVIPAASQFDVCFYSESNGVARFNNAGNNDYVLVTTDSGATWTDTTAFIVGNFFGADFKYVPGTASRLVSTGSATGAIGSSYSDDGGITWTDYETLDQRTALGIVDSTTMWAGGFTTSPTTGGIFKFSVVPCGDISIFAGLVSASDTLLCTGDTLTFTISNVVAPTPGAYSGFGWLISTADISGSADPLNDPSFLTSYSFSSGGPNSNTLQFINDGTLIDGTTLPYGYYYWTPVVFANATSLNPPPTIVQDLTLDPTCTYTGNSVMVNVGTCVPPPANDDCSGAIAIDPAFAGLPGAMMHMGPYDNTNATTNASDPLYGHECWGEVDGSGALDTNNLDNTMWYSFVGTGYTYFIETGTCAGVVNYISFGDTQLALYEGACGSLTADSCNEDGPNATANTYPAGFTIPTTLGTVYYMMVDGWRDVTVQTLGEYCILVTRLTGVGINENIPGKNVSLAAYPSPAKDGLTIEFMNSGGNNAVVTITDYVGRVVESNTMDAVSGLNTTTLNVKSLAAGAYIVSVKTIEGLRTAKFVKE